MKSAEALAITVACSGIFGCATAYRGVGSVVAEIRHDEVAAAVKMGNDHIALEGRVVRKELRAKKVAVLVSAYEAEIEDRNVGLLELEDLAGEPGKAVCLFDSDMGLRSLSDVTEGAVARVVCGFLTVDGQRPERVPVFHRCFATAVAP
ncbi:MAG: hypothetical protein JW940_13610 [Polyangiaceae bacterium]|nr:hypothetical protein [Polyangiaceae bacterium]